MLKGSALDASQVVSRPLAGDGLRLGKQIETVVGLLAALALVERSWTRSVSVAETG